MAQQVAKAYDKTTTAFDAAAGANLTGKVALVTGANSGIGKETVRVLALCGAKVYMLCRNQDKAKTARDDLIKAIQDGGKKQFDGSTLCLVECDVSSLESVKKCAAACDSDRIDYLILNAGVMSIPKMVASADGFEMHFAVNHLGQAYLAMLLTPLLVASAPSRVVVVTSSAVGMSPSLDFIAQGIKSEDGPAWSDRDGQMTPGWDNYAISKVCSLLFARAYNDKYAKDKVTCVSLHPGVITTNLQRELDNQTKAAMKNFVDKTIEQGASTTIRCVVMSDDEIAGGNYYDNCQSANASLRDDLKPALAKKEEEQKQDDNAAVASCTNAAMLWEWTEKILAKKGFKVE